MELSLFSLLQQSLSPFTVVLNKAFLALNSMWHNYLLTILKLCSCEWENVCQVLSCEHMCANMCAYLCEIKCECEYMWANFFCELMSELYGGWKHVCVYMYISMFWILRMCKWKCEWEHLEASDCLYLSPFVSKLVSKVLKLSDYISMFWLPW